MSNPIAIPGKNIEYLLKVVSTDGCEASGKVVLTVFSDLKMPTAFTPNGDGKNDVFKVIGGRAGSRIEEFSVFNRWGEIVFHQRNSTLDNKNDGCNGNYKGKAAPEGVYVYIVNVKLPDGNKQTHLGSVLLIR